MDVVFTYDGSVTVNATFTPENLTDTYLLQVNDTFASGGPYGSLTPQIITNDTWTPGAAGDPIAIILTDNDQLDSQGAAIQEDVAYAFVGIAGIIDVSFDGTYDGNTTIAATIHSSDPTLNYRMSSDDPSSTLAGPTAGTGGDITLTITDVGGLITDDLFQALLSIEKGGVFGYMGVGLLTFGSSGSFGGGGSTPGTPLPIWFVDLYNQDDTNDHNPNAKLLVATVRPENLHFTKTLGGSGTGDIDFELSLGATDEGGDPIVTPGFIGPYRTDFVLRRDDLAVPVFAGIITHYGEAKAGEEHVKVAGKGWLHYLERRHWPYDAGDGESAGLAYINYPDGFRFKVAAADVGQIVKDILEFIRDLSPNFPSAPGATAATCSYSLDYTVDVDVIGKTINYEITAFEPSTIYDLIQTLGEAEKGDGGFEFVMTVDKVFRLVESFGDPDAPALTLEVDADGVANMTEVAQTNTGPECTHVLGVGAGTSTRQGGVNKHFRNNSGIFRRLDKIADFGDVKNLDELETLSSESLSFGAYPVHEVPVEVDPNQLGGFWTTVRPGIYASVTKNLGYAQLPNDTDKPFKIVSMDCTVDLQGTERVELGLNQDFDRSAFAGLADW